MALLDFGLLLKLLFGRVESGFGGRLVIFYVFGIRLIDAAGEILLIWLCVGLC